MTVMMPLRLRYEIIMYVRNQLEYRFSIFQIRPGLIALSQRILGPNTLVQGALETILTKTPQEFFDSTIAVVKVILNDI
jgi:hypothetical protein